MVSVGLSATPERKKSISFSRAVRPVRPDPRGGEERHHAGDDRGVEHVRQDDHLAPGLDGRATRPEDVPERDVAVVPRPERGVPRGRDGPRERHRRRELPAGAVQQVERQQAQGGAVREAAARRVRLVRRPEGQHEARAST